MLAGELLPCGGGDNDWLLNQPLSDPPGRRKHSSNWGKGKVPVAHSLALAGRTGSAGRCPHPHSRPPQGWVTAGAVCRVGTRRNVPASPRWAAGRAGPCAGSRPRVHSALGGARLWERAALQSPVTSLAQGPALAVLNYRFYFICPC